MIDNDGNAFTFLNAQQARQTLTENLAPPDDRYCILSPNHVTSLIDSTKGLFHDQSAVAEQYSEGVIGAPRA